MKHTRFYEFMGNLATSLSLRIKISLSALNQILEDKSAGYGNNKGLASSVSAAYRYWKKKIQ